MDRAIDNHCPTNQQITEQYSCLPGVVHLLIKSALLRLDSISHQMHHYSLSHVWLDEEYKI